jgi:hypothetical protein
VEALAAVGSRWRAEAAAHVRNAYCVRGPGWRIHGSVEDTKLSTNKQHSLSTYVYVRNDVHIHMCVYRERDSGFGAGAAACKDPRLLYIYVDREKYIH